MAPPLIQLKDIALTFGGTPLLDGAELSVSAGERLCLVGRNGSGKSTLLKIAAGLIEADRGTRFVAARRAPSATCRRSRTSPASPRRSPMSRPGSAPGDDPRPRRAICSSSSAYRRRGRRRSSPAARRAARRWRACWRPKPDILLLDEPTNHLDLPAIEWLENELAALRSALVLISHDRRVPRPTCRARRCGSTAAGRGGSIAASAPSRRGATRCSTRRSATRHKLDRKIVAEEHWLRYGVTRAGASATQGGSPSCTTLRQARREQRGATGTVKLAATEADDVRHARDRGQGHLPRAYGERADRHAISRSACMRGDRIGIVGPNGAGKTTLLKLLTGAARSPTRGTVQLGANLQMATLDQHRASLDPERRCATR